MSEIDEQHSLRKKQQKIRLADNEKTNNATPQWGYFIIVICVAIVVVGLTITTQIKPHAHAEPFAIPANAVNAQAISTSWTCPILGNPDAGDEVILTNPDTQADANVEISVRNSEGMELVHKTIKVASSTTVNLALSSLGAPVGSVLLLSSYSAPVVVFQNMTLSDGPEFVTCESEPYSSATFPDLETIRNTDSQLVFANPYEDAVVVDITANLIDTTVTPPLAALDEVRGTIIPAQGTVTVSLQSTFGRYSVVGVVAKARGGFFVAQALATYTGGEAAQGQTVIHPSRRVTNSEPHYSIGVAPTRIVARNDDVHAHSVQADAFAADKRFVNGDSATLLAGSSALLPIPGAEFDTHALVFTAEKSSHPVKNISLGWLFASGEAVSSGDGGNVAANDFVIPAAPGDNLHFYNPTKHSAKITLHIAGTAKKHTLTVSKGSYVDVGYDTYGFADSSIVTIHSTQTISIGASDPAHKRYSSGIVLQP